MGHPVGVLSSSPLLSAGRADLRLLRGDAFSVSYSVVGPCGFPRSLFNINKGCERTIQLLPGIRIKVPNKHSTNGRDKVKSIQLFLGKYILLAENVNAVTQ